MAGYIERTEELVLAMNAGARAIENTRRYHGTIYSKDVFSEKPQKIPYLLAAKVLRGVEEAPAADVAPVVHGRWKLLHKGDWTSVFVCSVCGRRETITESESYNSQLKMPRKYPYCHCGARMDGEAE